MRFRPVFGQSRVTLAAIQDAGTASVSGINRHEALSRRSPDAVAYPLEGPVRRSPDVLGGCTLLLKAAVKPGPRP